MPKSRAMARRFPADPKSSPFVTGLALLGLGLLLRRWRPAALELPERAHGDDRNDTPAQRAARYTRDGVARVMPSNLTGSLGRTLIVAGACLLTVRALDIVVDDDGDWL